MVIRLRLEINGFVPQSLRLGIGCPQKLDGVFADLWYGHDIDVEGRFRQVHPGLIGGIIGSVIGIAGGAIGTYYSIKHTNGPLERAFMVRCTVIIWIAVIAFLGLLLLLPVPYRYFLWIPYVILLPWGITRINRRQSAIRESEKTQHLAESS